MKVLVVGSGGREHAIAWRLSRSAHATSLVSCPGNGGLSLLGQCWSDLDPERDQERMLQRIEKERVDLVVIGPEGPLVAGLGDRLRAAGVPAFGPDRKASQLEGSKAFAKDFMKRWGVPTPRFSIVTATQDLEAVLRNFDEQVVVKASGLAAGKGVVVAGTRAEARAAATEMLTGKRFGVAGQTIVIEEALLGVEVTLLVLVSDDRTVILEPAQDYKRLLDGNEGPNTGGMGAYSPTHLLTPLIQKRIVGEVLEPTLLGLREEGLPFRGILYLGLMLTSTGPQVLEYNVRFGDPETQPLMIRFQGDLLSLMENVARGELSDREVRWDSRPAVCVVLASNGYPGDYRRGVPIAGDVVSTADDAVQVFHAGTRTRGSTYETAGGRVCGVTAIGRDLREARQLAYERADRIHFEGKVMRRDIGAHGVGQGQ